MNWSAKPHFTSDSDTEVIGHLLVKELIKHKPVESIKNVMRRLIGSYLW